MLTQFLVGIVTEGVKFVGRAGAGLLLVLAATVTAGSALAAYPERPIRLVVPWPAGGTTDAIARVFAMQLGEKVGANIVVENRGGANGIIGTRNIAQSAPDGYSLLFATSDPISINPHIYASLPYDVEKDLEPIAFVGRMDFVIAARAAFPADDIRAAIALAKQQPGKINVASYGIADMFLGSFESVTGTEFTRVPFQGAGPSIVAVIAGQVDLTFVASFTAAQHLKGGRLKVLGVGSSNRLGSIPSIPTFIEQGLAGFKIANWLSVFAPRGTPPAVREQLSSAIESVVRSRSFSERAQSMGIEAEFGSPDQLRAFLKADSARWAKIAREKNIKAD